MALFVGVVGEEEDVGGVELGADLQDDVAGIRVALGDADVVTGVQGPAGVGAASANLTVRAGPEFARYGIGHLVGYALVAVFADLEMVLGHGVATGPVFHGYAPR